MARRPKTTEEEWYDWFADADVSEQVIMLQILQGIHRQARRGKLNGKPTENEKPAKMQGCAKCSWRGDVEGGVTYCPSCGSQSVADLSAEEERLLR